MAFVERVKKFIADCIECNPNTYPYNEYEQLLYAVQWYGQVYTGYERKERYIDVEDFIEYAWLVKPDEDVWNDDLELIYRAYEGKHEFEDVIFDDEI